MFSRPRPGTNWWKTPPSFTHLARESRLGTEKFMLDGRHSGTGGGNHVVIGAATPEDSAFLRRPDLLRSMVGFWQNHPSLSYLFSGLFIGPTSQHPRVDEARMENLYELEIAFSQVPDKERRRNHHAVAGRPHFPQPSYRSDRQHASHRNVHRQTLSARVGFFPPRPGGIARFRNAAARAHESHPATAGAGVDRALLAKPLDRRKLVPGERRCTTASCCPTSSSAISKTCSKN